MSLLKRHIVDEEDDNFTLTAADQGKLRMTNKEARFWDKSSASEATFAGEESDDQPPKADEENTASVAVPTMTHLVGGRIASRDSCRRRRSRMKCVRHVSTHRGSCGIKIT